MNSSRVYPHPLLCYRDSIQTVTQSQSLLVVCFDSPDFALPKSGLRCGSFSGWGKRWQSGGIGLACRFIFIVHQSTLPSTLCAWLFWSFCRFNLKEARLGNPNCKMASKYAFGKGLKELRFLFCQTSEPSAATRWVHIQVWRKGQKEETDVWWLPQVVLESRVSHHEEAQPSHSHYDARGRGYFAAGLRQIR